MARTGRQDRGLAPYRLANGSTRWMVRLWHRTRAHSWKGFPYKQEARDWYEDRKRDVREGKPFPARGGSVATVARTITRYLSQARHKHGIGNERLYAAFWTAYYGVLGIEAVTSLSIEEARILLLDRGATTKGPLARATVNRYVAFLKHVLMIEERQGRLVRNPCRGVDPFTEAPPPEEQFTTDEEAALARELGEDWACVRFALLTGLRQEEQFRLRWTELDLIHGYGRLPHPKGGEPEVFLLSDEAMAILRQRAGNGSPWVFPHKRDPHKPMNGKSWYSHIFKPACARAGIALGRAQGKTWHTLRHTFAARLQEAGVPVGDIKELGRWKSWKAMDRYLKRGKLRLRTAIERLSVPCGTESTPPLPDEASLKKTIVSH